MFQNRIASRLYLLGMLVALCLLSACATTAPPSANAEVNSLFADHQFAKPAVPLPTASEIFAIDETMRQYIKRFVADPAREQELYTNTRQVLVDALSAGGQIQLDYDATSTRNARDTFHSRSGNCLSLTIMSAALARELGLNVFFQQVHIHPVWGRQDNMQFAIGHVNMVVGERVATTRSRLGINAMYTVDFIRYNENQIQRTSQISEATILAMYMNNRAVELLTTGDQTAAYWHVRAAVLHDPQFAPAQITLGVIHRRQGNLQLAEHTLMHVLTLEPANTSALTNLVSLLGAAGREAESLHWQGKLLAAQPIAPFHHLDLGKKALAEGDLKKARDLFLREHGLGNDSHEVHFWLANAYYQLGDLRQTRNHLDLAVKNSPSRNTRALYAAKRRGLEDVSAGGSIQ